jgi:ABC-2 type transport system permease protein
MKKEFLRIFAYIYRNYVFAVRNIFTFFDLLFWPIIGIISIGMMSTFLSLDKSLLSFLLTGTITSGVLQVTQLEVSYGLLYEIWSKSIKQIFITPTKHYHYILGSWIVGTIRGLIVFILLSIISYYLFGFYLPKIDYIIVSLLGIFLTGLILGMFVNLFVLLYGQRVDIIAWSVSVLTMLICGIYYPVNILPKWLIKIAEFIPLTYFLEYFRKGYGFEESFKYGLLKGFILCIVYFFILFYLINLSHHHTKKTGSIIRLSE